MDCIVAPYEADAQLAYLMKCGIAQLVITEDSDLVLFGCDRVGIYIFFSRSLNQILETLVFDKNEKYDVHNKDSYHYTIFTS